MFNFRIRKGNWIFDEIVCVCLAKLNHQKRPILSHIFDCRPPWSQLVGGDCEFYLDDFNQNPVRAKILNTVEFTAERLLKLRFADLADRKHLHE